MDDRSVLVVEDNPILAESMAFALTTFGWTVVGPVATNADALRETEARRFATAVLDLDLGSESSLPVAEELRRRGIPFLFLTGHEATRDLPAPFERERWLSKPVTPEALVHALEASVENA